MSPGETGEELGGRWWQKDREKCTDQGAVGEGTKHCNTLPEWVKKRGNVKTLGFFCGGV